MCICVSSGAAQGIVLRNRNLAAFPISVVTLESGACGWDGMRSLCYTSGWCLCRCPWTHIPTRSPVTTALTTRARLQHPKTASRHSSRTLALSSVLVSTRHPIKGAVPYSARCVKGRTWREAQQAQTATGAAPPLRVRVVLSQSARFGGDEHRSPLAENDHADALLRRPPFPRRSCIPLRGVPGVSGATPPAYPHSHPDSSAVRPPAGCSLPAARNGGIALCTASPRTFAWRAFRASLPDRRPRPHVARTSPARRLSGVPSRRIHSSALSKHLTPTIAILSPVPMRIPIPYPLRGGGRCKSLARRQERPRPPSFGSGGILSDFVVAAAHEAAGGGGREHDHRPRRLRKPMSPEQGLVLTPYMHKAVASLADLGGGSFGCPR
ncbi:hypothetical protein DFH06DRAFT_1406775 [Mycena polygramma]|nr:hypothetical protein DFH06DRAFT_1406775 [Mycena polygramma]